MSDDTALLISQWQREAVASATANITRGQLGECWGTDDPNIWRAELQGEAEDVTRH